MRERAESPKAAQRRYIKFLQPALSCVSDAVWVTSSPGAARKGLLTTNERPVTLRRRSGLSLVRFQAAQTFEIVEDERYDGEWKVQTLSYIYGVKVAPRRLRDGESPDVIMWHWHPYRSPEHPEPHVHPPTSHRLFGLNLPDLHVPTGRVSFEDVIRFLISDVRVVPLDDEWPAILGETERRFRQYRTWA